MNSMMMNVSIASKMKTFFNKFVTQAKRDKTLLSVIVHQDRIIHTCLFDDLRISAVCNFSAIQDYAPVIINYNDWYKRISNEKEKEVQYMPLHMMNGGDKLAIGSDQFDTVASETEPCYIWDEILSCEPRPLADALAISNVVVGNGKMPFNSKIYFQVKDEKLKIINTNEIILNENTVNDIKQTKECIFSIDNAYISKLKTFMSFVSSHTKLTISICEGMIQFKCSNKNYDVDFVCPFGMDNNTTKIFETLDKILNSKWCGKLVTLNENDMFQDGLNDHISWLIQKKKKISSQLLKDELNKFNATADKKEAFKNLDKSIQNDFQYLNVSKAIGKDNVHIQKNLYLNYMASINEFNYQVYFLNTQAEALMFGGNDSEDALKFKTLFMLRKPQEPIEDYSEEEIDNINLESDTENVLDEETFEPT